MLTALVLVLLIVTLNGVTGQPVLLLVLGLESEPRAPVSRVTLNMEDQNVQKTRRSPVIEMFHAPSTASKYGVTGPVVFAAGLQLCLEGRGRGLGLERSQFQLPTKEEIVHLVILMIRKRPAGVRLKQELSGQWWRWGLGS